MKSIFGVVLVAILVFSLTACEAGDSFQQGMKDAMGDTSQETGEIEKEPEVPAETMPEAAD